MPEPSDQAAQQQRRANRIGLRTLRQRPKLAGALADGEPVYEVRSVRLVLRGHASHFNRLVACQRCGQDQPGGRVLSPADLGAPERPIICADCVRGAGISSAWEPEGARAGAARTAPPAADAPAPPAPPPTVEDPDGGRLDAVEHRLDAMGARVEELRRLAEAQQSDEAERRHAAEATQVALRGAISEALAGARADIASVAGENAVCLAALEADLRASLAALTEVVEAQRTDLTAMVTELMRARTEMHRAVAATQELAEAQVRHDQRSAEVAELAASAGAQELSRMQGVVDQRLHEFAAQMAEVTAGMDGLRQAHGESTSRLTGLAERLDLMAGQLVAERRERPTRPSTERPRPDSGNAVQSLQALELQLQGASERLAELSARRRGEEQGSNGGRRGLARPLDRSPLSPTRSSPPRR